MTQSGQNTSLFNPILISGCLILLVAFAIRASFGVFQIPISEEFGWLRADFSFAIAIQNLFWGIGQPLFGAFAEKFGDRRAIILGAICYAAGLVLSSFAVSPIQHQFLEILVGFGIAGTGFGVILAVVGRAVVPEKRSMALGITTAAGSAGQVVGPLTAEILLNYIPWQSVFIIFAAAVILSLAVVGFLKVAPIAQANPLEKDETLSEVLKKACTDPSYIMIFLGFFSCGYQLAFITAHFPAFITEMCSAVSPGSLIHSVGITTTSALGAFSIAVIGVFNIGGTIFAGWVGNKFPKKYALSLIYAARTLVAAWFIVTPMSPETVIVFSIAMGSLWLATVPLTSGLIAQIYGIKYMGTLYGLVFFSHQLGGFLGVWLGGAMYDIYQNYTLVWWISVGVGAFSALIHLPVRERPLRAQAA